MRAPRLTLGGRGITSSDVATKALGAKRARVVGQAGPGLPLWVLAGASVKLWTFNPALLPEPILDLVKDTAGLSLVQKAEKCWVMIKG